MSVHYEASLVVGVSAFCRGCEVCLRANKGG